MHEGDWKINRSTSMLPKGRRDLHTKIRAKVFSLLGGKCVHCSFSDVRALQIDHVKSNGSKEYKKYTGTSFLYHVLNNIDSGDYQLLCANCNWIKRSEAKEIALKYKLDHIFPTKNPVKHKEKMFRPKTCSVIRCCCLFTPTNGRQTKCYRHKKG